MGRDQPPGAEHAALAAEEAERRAANAVHDDVLSVLRAVSLADPQVPWSLVVSKARHAQDALLRQLARKGHGEALRRAEAVSRVDHTALDDARRVAGPVLDAVISSPVPDPDLRIAAALASATLRDELLAPGFLTPPLADRVRATRTAGANIIIDFAPQPETGLVQTARELLAAALAGLDAGSHATLQVHPSARERPPLLILHVRSRQSDHAALRRQAAECGALISDLGDHEFLVRLQPRPMDAVLPVPGPPGQQVRGRAAAGPDAMQQGEQQQQDARKEDRAAGQHDPKHNEHHAGNQEQGPPARAHDACEPHHPAGPGRFIQADVRGCVQEHPGPLLLSGATRFVVP